MEVAGKPMAFARGWEARPWPKAAAGLSSQAGLDCQLCSLPLGHCCAWAVPAPALGQMEACCQACLSLPQALAQLPVQPVAPSPALTWRCCWSSSGSPRRGWPRPFASCFLDIVAVL